MKVNVIDVTIYQGQKTYGPGQVADIDDKEAEALIAAGHASRIGAPAPGKTAEEIAEAAAKSEAGKQKK